jgi:hypothetical protein
MLKSLIIKLKENVPLSETAIKDVAKNSSITVNKVESLFPNAIPTDPASMVRIVEISVSSSSSLELFIKGLTKLQSVEYAHLPKKRDLL